MATFVVAVQNAAGDREFVKVAVNPPNDTAADARKKATQNGWLAFGGTWTEEAIPNDILTAHPNGFKDVGTLPFGGTVGGGGNQFGLPGDDVALEIGDTEAAFRRALANRGLLELGQPASNLAQRIAVGRSRAGSAAFNINDRLRAILDPGSGVGPLESPAEDFFGENFGRFGQSARTDFNRLLQVSNERRSARGNVGIVDDVGLQSLINPQNRTEAGIVFEAAREAFLSRFSPVASRGLARDDSVDSALSDFRAQGGVTGGNRNFIEDLRKRFGLAFAPQSTVSGF